MKSFTFIEILVYIILFLFCGILLTITIDKIFLKIEQGDKIVNFSKGYDKLLKLLGNEFNNGWEVFESKNGVILKKGELKKKIYCENGIFFVSSINKIEENFYYFDNIQDLNCTTISGYNSYSGYWLGIDLNILGNDLNQKFFIYNGKK